MSADRQEFFRLLTRDGVPEEAIRYEDRSANTWQNVENSLDFFREAAGRGLPVTILSKWYHRRTVHIVRTLVPELDRFYVISWEPLYAGQAVTRENWVGSPDGHRRVIREWQEVTRRLDDGSFRPVTRIDGAWR